jgi:WD40 repeat protein
MLLFLAGCTAGDILDYIDPFTWFSTDGVALSTDGEKVAAGGSPPFGRVWNINGGRMARLDDAPYIRCLRFSKDSTKIAVGGNGGKISLYDSQTGKRLWHNRESGGADIASIFFSSDEKYILASDRDGHIFLVAAETGKTVKTITEYTTNQSKFYVILSPNGESFAAFDRVSSEVKIYDVETEKVIWQSPAPELRSASSAAFTQDGKKIVICTPQGITVLDLQKQNDAVRTLSWGNDYNPDYMRLASDGRKLVVNYAEKIFVIDLETGKNILEFRKHRGNVTSLALSADGKHVLSSCDSTSKELRPSIYYWDIETGRIKQTFRMR